MKYIKLLFLILAFTCIPIAYAQMNTGNDRRIAIYIHNNGLDENYQATLSSVEQLKAVSGLPIDILSDYTACFEYGLIIFPSVMENNVLNNYQKEILLDHVNQGGILFSQV